MAINLSEKKIYSEITKKTSAEELVDIFDIPNSLSHLERLNKKVAKHADEIEEIYHRFIYSNIQARRAYIKSGKVNEIRELISKWIRSIFLPPDEKWLMERARLGAIHYQAEISPSLYIYGLSSLKKAIEEVVYHDKKEISDYEEIEAMRSIMDLERYITIQSYDICRFGSIESHSQKFQEVTRILAHDIANPLSISINRCNLAKASYAKNKDVDEVFKHIDQVGVNLQLIGNLIKSARNYIVDDIGVPDICVWKSVINNYFRLAKDLGQAKEINMIISDDVPYDTRLCINSIFLIFEVLLNIVNNAIKFSQRGENIYLNSHIVNNAVRIEITDNGPGMSAAQKLTIFKSEESTSGTEGEQGTGLGLGIAYRTIQSSGGQIKAIDNKDGSNGTTFVVDVLIETN